MRYSSTGFVLDFRRVFSRRVSGNIHSVLLEIVLQPLVVATLVFIAFLNRDKVDPYRLNFLYFSTLYAFWVGLFGSCQAINSEVRSGEWCYWVLGMGRNRTTHVLAIGTSCLLFAFVQCLVFLSAVVILSGIAGHPCDPPCESAPAKFNHFVDMFVSVPNGDALCDSIGQMNKVLWYVLSASWGNLGPAFFATSIFGLSLGAAVISGTLFGLLFGAVFREPATSLNIAVGFVVLLGMVSLCGLRGSGDGNDEKVGALFAPLNDEGTVLTKMKESDLPNHKTKMAATISYFLPQRYFFNIGQITFEKDWTRIDSVHKALCERLLSQTNAATNVETGSRNPEVHCKDPADRFHARWLENFNDASFPVVGDSKATGLANWIDLKKEERIVLSGQDIGQLKDFLRKHPEHWKGWKVFLYKKMLLSTIGMELLPILLFTFLCLGGTLFAVWKKPCYQQLR